MTIAMGTSTLGAQQRVHGGPLSVERAVRYGAEAARALAAHAGPDRPSRRQTGENPDHWTTVKVLDFGLATLTEASPNPSRDAPTWRASRVRRRDHRGHAPQQASKAIDQRSASSRSGVVLFEMLSGRRPGWRFSSSALLTVRTRRRTSPRGSTIPRRSTGSCAAAWKKPSERYQSVRRSCSRSRCGPRVRDFRGEATSDDASPR